MLRERIEPKITQRFGIDGVSFREVVYPDGYDMSLHDHDTDCYVFVLQGVLTGKMGSNDLCASKTNLFYVPTGEMHTNQFHGLVRTFDIVPTKGYRVKFADHILLSTGFKTWEDHASTLVASRMYREFLNSDPATPLILTGLMMELVGEISRTRRVEDSSPPAWLASAIDFIHANLSDQFTLEDIGLSVGIHPAHLARVFRKYLACTVGEYLRRLRLDQACHLMMRTDDSLADIGFNLGFVDQSHFSRVFKQGVGVTPSEYRRKTRLQTSYKKMRG